MLAATASGRRRQGGAKLSGDWVRQSSFNSAQSFALNEDRSLFAFAGIWSEFKGDRGTKSEPVPALTSSTGS